MSSEESARPLRRPLRASSSIPTPSARTTATAVKRDSLAAELERDPQFSTAKRQHRTQLFTNSISHASLERQLLQAQTARIELEAKLGERELVVQRLERDRRHYADREREEREAREQLEAEFDTERKRTSAELSSLRSSLSALQESHADLQNTHSQLSLSSSQSISSQKALVASLTSRTSHLESSLSSAESLAESRLSEIHALKDELDELREEKEKWIHGVTEEQDSTVVRGELKRQAEYLQKLEGANSRMNAELISLRERHQSIEVLREQNRSLEAKVAYTETLRQKVAGLEAELVQAKASSSKLSPPSTPSISDTQTLSSLRLKHASLLDTHGSTLASLRSLQHQHSELESQLASATTLAESLQRQVKDEKEARRKDDARARLLEREVKFLNGLVASYQAEEGMQDEEGEAKANDTQLRRVAELEALVEEYKSTLASLPSPSSTTPPTSPSKPPPSSSPASSSSHVAAPPAELLKELEDLKSENTAHLARIDELEQQLFDLSGEIAGGRHVPPNTRVLQLADNPEQRWFDLRQQTMDQLKAENEALLKRLKELSSAAPPTTSPSPESTDTKPPIPTPDNGNLIPLQSYTTLQSNLSSLESQLAQKEKRLLRLTQVFHSKATEFREAIAAILGVKLAFYPNGQVRVTSVFDLNASFVFQPASGGGTGGASMKMQLVAQGEGGPQDLPSLMRYWIENEQCPPGFMASVTLECYEKAKREADE